MWLIVHNNQIELRREEERGRVKAAAAFISTMTKSDPLGISIDVDGIFKNGIHRRQ